MSRIHASPLTPLAFGLLLGLTPPAQAQDHSQHRMPTPPAHGEPTRTRPEPAAGRPSAKMDHSKMDHSKMDHSGMPHDGTVAPAQPREPIPPVTAADRAAAFPPVTAHADHGNSIQHYVLFNRLEAWDARPGSGLGWEGKAWIGTDLDRLWLRSEGERVGGVTQSASLELMYGRSVAPWWDVLAGVRQDFGRGPARTWAAFGVQGLAPYKFEVQATAYLGDGGRTAARVEVEYETLLTNRLILQPLLEANLYGRDDPRRGIGSGLSTLEAGLRLRYEFTRQFAPYVGLVREHAFGRTADFRRAAGEDIHDTRFVVGLRTWF